MRHLPILLGAAVLSACLFASSSQATAGPLPPLSATRSAGLPVEKAWYGYGGGYGYGGYCHRGYGYGYGYGYRPSGYGYRPYRRYGWRY
jgi:hypothetical protein